MRTLPKRKRTTPFEQTIEATTFEKWDQNEYHDILYINCKFEGDLYPSPRFESCRFDTCSFGPDNRTRFIGVMFVNCEIIRCDFGNVEITESRFENCLFLKNTFDYGTILAHTRLIQALGLQTNANLHLVRNEGEAELDEDLIHAPLPLVEKIASWERLRTSAASRSSGSPFQL
jgi:hypothetical protein